MLTKLPRWVEGLILAAVILFVIYAALHLTQEGVQANQIDLSKSCTDVKGWRWIGCAMAAHENLAGGLIGGAGALFAAWLAASAVREQIADERKRDRENKEITARAELTGWVSYCDRFNDLLSAFDDRLSAFSEDHRWRNVLALQYLHSAGWLEIPTGPYPGEMAPEAQKILNGLRSMAAAGNSALHMYDPGLNLEKAKQLGLELDALERTVQQQFAEARNVQRRLALTVPIKEEALRKIRG
jgi:hypothetical protein